MECPEKIRPWLGFNQHYFIAKNELKISCIYRRVVQTRRNSLKFPLFTFYFLKTIINPVFFLVFNKFAE